MWNLKCKEEENQPSEVCARHLTCLYVFYFQKLAAIPPSAFYHKEHKHLGENYIRFCFIKVSAFFCLNNKLLSLLIHICTCITLTVVGFAKKIKLQSAGGVNFLCLECICFISLNQKTEHFIIYVNNKYMYLTLIEEPFSLQFTFGTLPNCVIILGLNLPLR